MNYLTETPDFANRIIAVDKKEIVVEAPVTWSDNAVTILYSKYFRKAGVPKHLVSVKEKGIPNILLRSIATYSYEPNFYEPIGPETSARQVFHRLAGSWAYHGLKNKYFTSKQAVDFYNQTFNLLANQVFAPNSPQWFNNGLYWAYGIEGESSGGYYIDSKTGEILKTTNSYEHPQCSACFISSIEDSLMDKDGIMDMFVKEARIFKGGSGNGANYSKIRGENEPLSHGGKSSGLMSFLKVGDASAGAIKSGGTCLMANTPVMTETGLVPVEKLVGKKFIVFSKNIKQDRIIPKWATAFESGIKECVRITTDKGVFETSYDHPFLTKAGRYVNAANLKYNERLSQSVFGYGKGGYPRYRSFYEVDDSDVGRVLVHRAIAKEFVGDIENKDVHHDDENILNSHPRNLEILKRLDHAKHHANDVLRKKYQRKIGLKVAKKMLKEGNHPFQLNTYTHVGEENGMHVDSKFWKNNKKVKAYKNKQRNIMLERGDAAEMQQKSANQRMINFGFSLIDAGYEIDSFDSYFAARNAYFKNPVKRDYALDVIKAHFGSYKKYYNELCAQNHKVLSVEPIGKHVVYDVQVRCKSPEDKSRNDNHNFAIGSIDFKDPWKSSVTFVHNTRRAARLVVLNDDHPDLEEFIDWKMKEEAKVAMLDAGSRSLQNFVDIIKAELEKEDVTALSSREGIIEIGRELNIPDGFINRVINAVECGLPLPTIEKMDSTNWQSEAYQTVSGQNANNSVAASYDFMQAVELEKDWNLNYRTGGVKKTVKARDLWDKISYAAWACADPGLFFIDTINDWHTTPNNGKIVSANPCVEFLEANDNSCNLACINLKKMLTAEKTFSQKFFIEVCKIITNVLDITVGLAQYPTYEIALETSKRRTLGLGYANLGGLLMTLGIPYDSSVGRYLAAGVTALMHATAFETSAKLASKLGAFPIFENNKDEMLRVIENHWIVSSWYTYGKDPTEKSSTKIEPYFEHYNPFEQDDEPNENYEDFADLHCAAYNSLQRAWELGHEVGFRNSQVTLLMPSGTVGLAMDCDTLGIEPDFALVKSKSLAGGGYMEIVNQSVRPALESLGYDSKTIGEIEAFVLKHKTIESCSLIKTEHLAVFDCATTSGNGTRSVSPYGHIRMMAAVQPFLSGGISKTVNLPNNATRANVSEIYWQAHNLGIKAIALYRDGSKFSQPLMSAPAKKEKLETIIESNAEENAERIAKAEDKLFIESLQRSNVALRHKLPNERRGTTVKAEVGGHKIYLRTGEYEDGTLGEIFLDMAKEGAAMRSIANSLAIAVSIGLQHGVPLEEYVDAFTFTRFEPSGNVTGHNKIKRADSFLDFVFRDLAIRYLGRNELAHVQGSSDVKPLEPIAKTFGKVEMTVNYNEMKTVVETKSDYENARLSGYTGDMCSSCGSFKMRRSGTCQICEGCGQTTGCS